MKNLLSRSNLTKLVYNNHSTFWNISVMLLSLIISTNISAQNLNNKTRTASFETPQNNQSRATEPSILEPNTTLDAIAAEAELIRKQNLTYNEQTQRACDGTYCVPSFNYSVYPITKVKFAGINNNSPNTVGGPADREAFCDVASAEKGQTYNITVRGNTAGGYTFYERAYFDWNQNGVFGDVANEIYNLGTLSGTNGANIGSLTTTITVPTSALTGNTRMRVMHRFSGYSTNACQTGNGYGQAEDYNVTITGSSNYCEPESLNSESNLYFDDVEFIGTLNDISNLNNGYSSTGAIGYQDHTALTNSIQAQGEGINISAEANSRGHIKAWVDWNSDFSFDNTELVFDSNYIATSSTTFGFIVPANQDVGDYTLRIRMYNSYHYYYGSEYYSYDYDACENFDQNGNYDEYGETEDYTFTVIESCSAIVENIIEAENCGAGSVVLEAIGSTGTTSYNWYANETDTAPIATTTTQDWTTPNLTNTTDFYVTAVNGTCESLVKTKITATIKATTTLTFTPGVPQVCGVDDVIELSASGANEVVYLLNEDFEGGGLGVFTNNNIRNNGAAENAITNWQQRTSTYIPSEQVWFPAISSGFGANNFAMATSDAGTPNITENALESGILDTSLFTDLTFNFDMYFSRYFNSIPENVNIEVSTNGGTNWTSVQLIENDLGYGTAFKKMSLNLSAYVNESNFKIRIRYYADFWCDGVAIDNIELFGSKPLTTSFSWTSGTPIDAYLDAATTIPYVSGNTTNTVYVKPTALQLQSNSFTFIATATLSNGCNINQEITIDNNTKFWNGSSSTNWNNPNNWSPNGVPTAVNCAIIPDEATISGSGYEAYARRVIIESSGDLELQSGNNLTITESLEVETGGNFEIKDSASLIQIEDDANIGVVKIERKSQPMYKFDYTYWSSPITSSSGYLLQDLSPDTLGDKFYTWQPTQAGGSGIWTAISNTNTMTNGIGYAIRAPQSFSSDPLNKTIFTTLFTGTPANGNITIPIAIGTDNDLGVYYGDTAVALDDDQWNLIGNPYASALDIVSFLNDPANTAIVDGTAYLWTHNSALSTGFADPFYADYSANYTSNDYASVNSFGSTSTAASGGQTPTQYIASGQGFFVMGLSNGNVTFTNSMRVKNNNNNFFRTVNKTNSNKKSTTLEKHRIWLNLSNNNGAFSQTLFGYATGATNGWDRGIDALAFGGNDVTLYTLAPDLKLTIQGKPLPFNVADVIPLGYKAITQGEFKIGIDHVDQLFNDKNIYLKDKVLNSIHNLKSSPYVFETEIGTFEDRFEIVFRSRENLSLEENEINSNEIKVISNSNLKVISNSKTIIGIEVYDILGKKLINYKNLKTNKFTLKDLRKTNSPLLLKVLFSDNSQLFKKAIF